VPHRVTTLPHPSPAAGPELRRIEPLPNCSLTPRAARWVSCGIAVWSLTIALGCVAGGCWPVLPFAGLELAMLGWALWLSLRRRHCMQTVELGDADAAITTRDPRGCRRILFSRQRAKVTLRGPRGWQPSRLLIDSHGRACEVGGGGFPAEEQRRALWQRLRPLIGRSGDAPPLTAAPGAAGARPGRGG
jgi:uncharacterized membrane protein